MRPVEQRKLYRPDDHPDGPQRGDCLRACVASILEVEYEDVPDLEGYHQGLHDWLRTVAPGVVVRQQCLTPLDRAETVDDWKSWPHTHYEPDFWIAGVWSPRIPDVEVFGCGCASKVPGGDPACRWCGGKPETRSMGIRWGLHAVVMRNGSLAWDPHPERDGAAGPFRSATTFRLSDPAPAFHALRGVVA